MLADFFFKRDSAIRHCEDILAILRDTPFPKPLSRLENCGYSKETLAFYGDKKAKEGDRVVVAARAFNLSEEFNENELRACLFRGVIITFSNVDDNDPEGVAFDIGIMFVLSNVFVYTATGWVSVPDMHFVVEEDTRVLFNIPIECD